VKIKTIRLSLHLGLSAILLAGCYPQLFAVSKKQIAMEEKVSQQKAGIERMLIAKNNAHLQTVLELPVMKWPEPGARENLNGYQLLLPHLLDGGTKTRWSYGLTVQQPEFGTLIDLTSENQMLAPRAKTLGFDGILVEKAGYTPQELATLSTALDSSACKEFDAPSRSLYTLCH